MKNEINEISGSYGDEGELVQGYLEVSMTGAEVWR
jgi:hypothetical protein